MHVGYEGLAAELRGLFLIAERRARAEGRGLTKPSVAKRVGVSASSLYAYLAGTTLPPSDVFDALLIAFGVEGPRRAYLATVRDHIAIGRRAEPVPAKVAPSLEFAILGPLRVLRSGSLMRLSGLRRRTLLTALLLEQGRPVEAGRLAEVMWDGCPPASWRGDMQAHVSRLRRVLCGPAESGQAVVVRSHDGYLIPAEAGSFDLTEFDRLSALASRQNPAEACATLRQALALWRGPVLADVTPELARSAAHGLNERRTSVLERQLELELSLGRSGNAIGELRDLVAEHPGRELPRRLLAQAIEASRPPAVKAGKRRGFGGGNTAVTPQELPPDMPSFVGHEAQLAELDALAGHAERADYVVIAALSGAAGVGKSALAIRSAHRIKHLFPDGQLYADLRETGSAVVVLTRFLRTLAAAPVHPDPTLEELAARFRSHVADKRLLVVIDNARTAAQVNPLLPGTPTAMVLVTSRRVLPLMPGTVHKGIATLSHRLAVDLLTRMLGDERTRGEPVAVAMLARQCGHLPLALCIAAARLIERPHWPIAMLVGRLTDERQRLSELQIAGQSLRGSFAASYAELADSPAAARLFRLLGQWNRLEFTAVAASALAGLNEVATERLLETLTSAQLIESPAPGCYRMPDLLRLFAREHISGRGDDDGAGRTPELSRVA
ncbi:BTAD domain-containing putative transcriptional regulator [Micromonospora sp. NPDC006766]|uniref:BTAD domain-containing putative transcriptional regulator n=1 Tax=Micromonospora sp. NPDC006766 TaxID=3154778 RepID=UPI0033F5D942